MEGNLDEDEDEDEDIKKIGVSRLAPAHPPLAHPNLASGLNKISAIAVGLEIRGVRGKGQVER